VVGRHRRPMRSRTDRRATLISQRHDLGALPGAREPAALDPDRCLRTVWTSIGRRAQQRRSPAASAGTTPRRPARSSCEPPPTAAPAGDRRHRPPAPVCKLSSRPSVQPRRHRMAGFDHPDPPRRHAMAVAVSRSVSRDGARPSSSNSAARGRGHRGRSLAGADQITAFRHGAQMRGKRDVGCAAATAASKIARRRGVCRSSSASWDLRWKHATPVIHPIQAKENPRSALRGSLREPEGRNKRREASAADVASMMSPKRSSSRP